MGARSLIGRLSAAAGCLLEALAGLAASLGALRFCYPAAWAARDVQLFARKLPPDAASDLGGTLFLLFRSIAGESGRHTRLLGWPVGSDLGRDLHNTIPTDILGHVAGRLPMPLAYDLGVTAFLVANGLAVQLAARLCGAGRAASLLAGALAAVSPLCVVEVLDGRPVTVVWAPAVAAVALCLAALESRRRLVLALPGLALFGLALAIYPYGPALLAPWAVGGAAACLCSGSGRPGRVLRCVLVAAGCAAVLAVYAHLAPVGPRMALAMDPLAEPRPIYGRLLPSELFYGHAGGWAGHRVPVSAWWLLALCGALALRSWRSWVPAAAAGIALLAVGLGPDPAGGQGVVAWSPYALLLRWIPWYHACPRPDRYAMPGYLLLVLAASLALDGVARRWSRRLAGALLPAAAAWPVLLQCRPEHIQRLQEWPPLPALEALSGDRVVLDLPLLLSTEQVHYYQYAMLRVPRLNPLPASLPAWRSWAEGQGSALLVGAAEVQAAGDPPPGPSGGSGGGAYPGLRHVLLHTAGRSREELEPWWRLLRIAGARRVSEMGEGLVLYELPEDPPGDR